MCSNESAIIEASFAFRRYQVAEILMPSQSHYHGTHSQPASCQVIEGNEAMAVILMNSDEVENVFHGFEHRLGIEISAIGFAGWQNLLHHITLIARRGP
nr:hypothetical protein Iba_chr01aCG0880 [Ipomoea batatas]GMC56579.1 hypothetical protein Iba_chr01fCG8450 [Ipomoea batatas]